MQCLKNGFVQSTSDTRITEKNTVEAKQWLDKHYPDSAPSERTIKRWYTDFKRGRTDTDDAERPGRPNKAVTPENIEKTFKIIMGNRKVKLQEIPDILKLSKDSAFTVLHEHLAMKKLLSK
ncbi:protein GVQW3-like [Anastrepha obliqua]|uniref:protein GVQW3-like n=1 Tax=Anastrepha obliqua TaxID=95512 RepID=UPI0024091B76|nr:protein GVQW3-like [Anastrepha obliqua]